MSNTINQTMKINIGELERKIQETPKEDIENIAKNEILQIENLTENLTPENFHSFKNYIQDGGKLILLFNKDYKTICRLVTPEGSFYCLRSFAG